MSAAAIVQGNVAPGYEAVRKLYEEVNLKIFDKPIWILTGCAFQDFARGSDVDSQLCVYVKGERVVDLWGSHGPNKDANYGPDSLQNIFSSGKSVASVCMARLVDKGLLDYNEKVSKYWPGICSLCHA